MTLKVVMSPTEPVKGFVEQFYKLLSEADISEFNRVLEMKGIRKVDQAIFVEHFKSLQPSTTATSVTSGSRNMAAGDLGGTSLTGSTGLDEEESRIKKLEKLIKKRL